MCRGVCATICLNPKSSNPELLGLDLRRVVHRVLVEVLRARLLHVVLQEQTELFCYRFRFLHRRQASRAKLCLWDYLLLVYF